MSNPIDDQTEILSQIVGYLYDSAPPAFDEAICTFDYSLETDGSWSVGSMLSYISNGSEASEFLKDPDDQVPSLVARLRAAMLAHTGGAWDGFTLSLKNGGGTNVKFKYP